MPFNNHDVEQLKVHFLSKLGGAISGAVKPSQTDTIDLGSASQRFGTIYAKNIIADTVNGGSGSGSTDADTVDGIHANVDIQPGALLPLDSLGVFPQEVYHLALLTTGERTLSGNLAVGDGYVIDGIDLSVHTHNGMFGHGAKIDHRDLLANETDVHPQYAQRGVDETITGNWMFTDVQDRSVGWRFEPVTKAFRAYPHNLSLLALQNYAEIKMGPGDEIVAHVDDANVFLNVGLGSERIHLSGSDANYRLWAGAATGVESPFSVKKDGSVTAKAGNIGGWTIKQDRLEASYVTLLAAGELWIGDGSLNLDKRDYTVLSAIDPDGWRLWVGSDDPAIAPFRVNRWGQVSLGDAFVTGELRSSNYVQGMSGFSLEQTGRAEFNSIIARGRIETAVFSEKKISAVSGTMMIADAASLQAPVAPEDEEILLDSAIFNRDDILIVKGVRQEAQEGGGYVSFGYTEYMKVTSEPELVGDDTYHYHVVRDLSDDGRQSFKEGDAFVRMGNAAQSKPVHALASGEVGAEYGHNQPGGSGSTVEGGWLVLEGSRGVGPYFAVARRRGPLFNQFDEVVRIGNLRGIGVLDEGRADNNPYYGAFFGDAAAYLAYDADKGLRIKTRSGATAIDSEGVTTDQFTLSLGSTPGFTEDRAALYLWDDNGQPRIGAKMQISGVQVDVQDITGVGPTGPAGEAGPSGPAGQDGVDGTTYRGDWNGTTAYIENEIVNHIGASWVCVAANTGQEPFHPTQPMPLYWECLGTIETNNTRTQWIHESSETTALDDGDELAAVHSINHQAYVAYQHIHRITFANLKASLRTFFETLFAPLSHGHSENLLTSGLSEWDEQAETPAAPAANKHKVYFKADGKFYRQNDAGEEVEVGSGAGGGEDVIHSHSNKDVIGVGFNPWVILPPVTYQNGLRYSAPFLTGLSATIFETSWPKGGVISNLAVTVPFSQPTDGDLTVTLFVNGEATPLVATVPAGGGNAIFEDSIHTVVISPGDKIYIEFKNYSEHDSCDIQSWSVVLTDSTGGGTGAIVGTRTHHDQSGEASGIYGALVGSIDGANQTFRVSKGSYMAGTLQVYLNGQMLIPGAANAWVETTPTSGEFYLNDAPLAGDVMMVSYQTTVGAVLGEGDRTDQSGGTSDTYGSLVGNIDGVNTLFEVSAGSYVSGALKVYLNGQLQTQGTAEDWVEVNPLAGTFAFTVAPVVGDQITVAYKVHGAGSGDADTLDGYHASDFVTVDAIPAPLPAYRNILINGDMQVTQRGTSESNISSGYACRKAPDRWKFGVNGGTFSVGQGSGVPAGEGVKRNYYVTCAAANPTPATNNYLFIEQQIEGQLLQHVKKGTANAQPLTLSFWVKSSKVGTYIVELVDIDNGKQVSAAYTVNVADTFERKTVTFPADTTGEFDNDNAGSLRLLFWLSAGSDFASGTLQTAWVSTVTANRAAGQVNFAGTVGNVFSITKVQLEIGDTATEFEHLPFDVQLQRCMRYYQKSYNYAVVPGSNTFEGLSVGTAVTTAIVRVNQSFAVPLRANPTLVCFTRAGTQSKLCYAAASGTEAGTTVTPSGGEKSIYTFNDSGTGFTVGTLYMCHWTADAEL